MGKAKKKQLPKDFEALLDCMLCSACRRFLAAFCMTEDHLSLPEVRAGKTNIKSFGTYSSPRAGPQIPFKAKLFALQAGSMTSLNVMEASTGTSRTKDG